MQKLTDGDLVKCPHCGKAQEEPVQEFVIPGRIGEASVSNNECIWCDRAFSVEKVSAAEFLVSVAS